MAYDSIKALGEALKPTIASKKSEGFQLEEVRRLVTQVFPDAMVDASPDNLTITGSLSLTNLGDALPPFLINRLLPNRDLILRCSTG